MQAGQEETVIDVAQNQRVIIAIMCAQNQMSMMMSGEMSLYLAHERMELT